MTATNGKTPPNTGEQRLRVRFRNGNIARAEQPAHWWKRWKHNGGPFDLIEVEAA